MDGLTSAALVKMATGAHVLLADYGDFIQQLRRLRCPGQLYVCDLGLSERTLDPLVRELRRLGRHTRIHYVDHHPIEAGARRRILDAKIQFTHSTEESAAVLVHELFKAQLPPSAALLAAMGAVTDYLDAQPIASRIMGRFDRQLVLLEATLLSYAIAGRTDDKHYTSSIVTSLARPLLPHQIPGVPEAATEQAQRLVELMATVREQGRKRKHFACMEAIGASGGSVANTLIGSFDVPVGVAYRFKKDENVVELSLRSSRNTHVDLGPIAAAIAEKLGGFGGGHPKASGARIPDDQLDRFLQLLDDHLARGR